MMCLRNLYVECIKFKMECTLPLVTNGSTGLNDLSLPLNETVDLEDSKRVGTSGTIVEIYK